MEGVGEGGKAQRHRVLRVGREQGREKRLRSPNDGINELEVLLRQTVPAGIELRFRLPPDVGSFRVSPGAFDASLINLVVNATHAMPEGGELRITTGNRSVADGSLPSGDLLSVSVAVTGHRQSVV